MARGRTALLRGSLERTDPDGRIVETVLDVANIAMGATSAYSNFSQGNVGAGIVDSIGVAIDATAAAVPFVPEALAPRSRPREDLRRLSTVRAQQTSSATRARWLEIFQSRPLDRDQYQ